MENLIVGLLCLGAVVGFVLLAFRNSRPVKAGAGKLDETNKHSMHGQDQVAHGSNAGHWSMWGDPGAD